MRPPCRVLSRDRVIVLHVGHVEAPLRQYEVIAATVNAYIENSGDFEGARNAGVFGETGDWLLANLNLPHARMMVRLVIAGSDATPPRQCPHGKGELAAEQIVEE